MLVHDSGWARMFIRRYRQTLTRKKEKKSLSREQKKNNPHLPGKGFVRVKLAAERIMSPSSLSRSFRASSSLLPN